MTIYADDLRPGQRFTLARHTVTEDEILRFAREWDPVLIHTDPAAARELGLGGVIASGLHTLAVYQRLAVEALWSQLAGGIGRSFEITFRRPVRPGATLHGHTEIVRVSPRTGRGDAVVVAQAKVVDHGGEVVLDVVNESVLPMRESTRR